VWRYVCGDEIGGKYSARNRQACIAGHDVEDSMSGEAENQNQPKVTMDAAADTDTTDIK
jgi:hypothetical protein